MHFSQLLHNMPQIPPHWTGWFNPALMLNKPILMAAALADSCKKLETLPGHKLVGMIMEVLKPWFAAQKIQVPVPIQRGFQRSNWGSDPFAYGSILNPPTGATPLDHPNERGSPQSRDSSDARQIIAVPSEPEA